MFSPEILERVKPGALVVSGSRSITSASSFAIFVCDLALQREWCIVVGDAGGVDTSVINEAAIWDIPLVILGCEAIGGLRIMPPVNALSQLISGGNPSGSCFVIRDEALAKLAATADKAGFLGLWDGHSKGTQHTARFCRLAGIPGTLINVKGNNQRWEGNHVV